MNVERFVEKYEYNPATECWDWTASKNTDGYGQFGVDRAMQMAHRLSYERHFGPIPAGLQVDHLCRNPSCVNPWHMEPVTQQENILRGYKSRGPKTHCIHGHEFTEENTMVRPRGHRECRTCIRERQRVH